MKARKFLWPLLYLLVTCSCANGLIERLYCGKYNCYELLGIKNTADSREIKRGYREMAVKYHPDKNKEPGASEMFQLVRTAYEILKDDEERLNYDYLLENPDDIYRHYYHYYKKRVKPKVDIRVVLVVVVLGISAFQYPKYRQQAIDLAREKGIWVDPQAKLSKKDMKRVLNKKDLKDEMRQEEEAILIKVLRERVNVIGGYRKATISDLLVSQLVLFPYRIVQYIWWCLRWHVKFNVREEPLGVREKVYLTRARLGLSESQWEAVGDQVKLDMLSGELWEEKNWNLFKESQQDQIKAKMAESSRFKMYRRYMKKSRQTVPDYLQDDY